LWDRKASSFINEGAFCFKMDEGDVRINVDKPLL
jgi:hypothetical protein